MKIAVWKTGHPIADTVAQAFGVDALSTDNADIACNYDINIGYGILRGMDRVMRCGKPFIHLDRGYFNPCHFDGYYRLSLNDTQQVGRWPEPDYERLEELQLNIAPWRGFDSSKPVLVCPPTDAVSRFFGIDWQVPENINAVIRRKGDSQPIRFDEYNYVLTFNSGVGWQALQAGIPCVSDSTYSIVGSWYKNILLDQLSEHQYNSRHALFASMSSLQYRLSEIREGRVCKLIQFLTST